MLKFTAASFLIAILLLLSAIPRESFYLSQPEPLSFNELYQLSQRYSALGKSTDIVELYESNGKDLLRKMPALKQTREYISFVVLAYAAQRDLKAAKAIASNELLKSSAKNAGNAELKVALGRSYLASGEIESALIYFKSALRVSRRNEASALAAYWLALSEFHQVHHSKQVAFYLRRISIGLSKSNNPWARNLRLKGQILGTLIKHAGRLPIGVEEPDMSRASLEIKRQLKAIGANS